MTMTLLRTRHLTYVLAALSVTAAAVPQHARAEDGRVQAASEAGAAADHWCSTIPPGFGHPPVNFTVPTLQVLQRSIEPVPATDGLIHLVYAALVTSTGFAVQIVSVVPVDPLTGFTSPARSYCSPRRRTTLCRPIPRSPNPCLASRRACQPGTRGKCFST
jgi:hypothetical protein